MNTAYLVSNKTPETNKQNQVIHLDSQICPYVFCQTLSLPKIS